MIIREAQLRALHQAQHRDYHRGLADRLRRILKEKLQAVDDETLLATISDAHRRAPEFGVTSQDATSKFVGLAVVQGAEFYNQPAALQVLQRADIDGDEKIRLLTTPQGEG